MIAGMMRVRNEARWIERCVRSLLPCCGHVFIMDDHSTDGTAQICAAIPGVTVFDSPFEGLNETRDKNWLFGRVAECSPEWVVHIDGDEEIAPGDCNEIVRVASTSPRGREAYHFRVLYLWDRADQIRVDGVYGRFHRGSMFRFGQGMRFVSSNGGGFHCGNVPDIAGERAMCGVKLLHYGYLHREDRIRKFEWYNAPDKQPIPPCEDGYRHMVIGDLFPAESRFQHAGPLLLEPLNRPT